MTTDFEPRPRNLTPDDLEPGQYILTTGLRGMLDDAGNPIQFGLDGRPIKIMSVCLPFCVIEVRPGEHGILDTRRHLLSRVSPEYVAAVRSLMDKRPPELPSPPSNCIQCGHTLGLMIRRSADGGAVSSNEFCPHCHWEGP